VSEDTLKWQPVMIVSNKRLECLCGALAIFVTGKAPENNEYNSLIETDAWCQSCFQKHQEEEK
jgi:hypothetical protein